MHCFMLLKNTVLFFTLFIYFTTFGQGQMPKNKGSYKAALMLMPSPTLSQNFYGIPCQAQPYNTDPYFATGYKYQGTQGSVSNFIKEAVMYVEWWTLLNEPVERYMFKWISSGFYTAEYTDSKGRLKIRTINRQELQKYPDLLASFDNIAPIAMGMEVNFNIGEIDDDDYNKFKKKYNILTSLGSAGYKPESDFVCKIKDHSLLLERSGRDAPLVVPEMSSGWPAFTNTKNTGKFPQWIELLCMGKTIAINSFKVTNITWPVDGMISIAKRLDKYEEDALNPTPAQQVDSAKAPGMETLSDDFWNKPDVVDTEMEIYKDPSTGLYGLKNKTKVLPATHNSLTKVKGQKTYFYSDKSIFEKSGQVITINGESIFSTIVYEPNNNTFSFSKFIRNYYKSKCNYGSCTKLDFKFDNQTKTNADAFISLDNAYFTNNCMKPGFVPQPSKPGELTKLNICLDQYVYINEVRLITTDNSLKVIDNKIYYQKSTSGIQ